MSQRSGNDTSSGLINGVCDGQRCRGLRTSDVSIYKSDFDIDYFHVNKFDFDFFDTRICVVTQRGCFHLINLLRHIFRQLTVSSVSYSSRNTLIQSLT
jgi:hypothetical protein